MVAAVRSCTMRATVPVRQEAMTKDEFEEQETSRQMEQNRLSSTIRSAADGNINPPASTAEGDRLQMEAIRADEELTSARVREHREYSEQSDAEKQSD